MAKHNRGTHEKSSEPQGDAGTQESPPRAQAAQRPEPRTITVPVPERPREGQVLENKTTMAVRMMARKMYTAFLENQGESPGWENLSSEERSHWCAAVLAAMPHLNNV